MILHTLNTDSMRKQPVCTAIMSAGVCVTGNAHTDLLWH
jgi:hypothetical protein